MLKSAKFFSKLDLASGYFQIEMEEESQDYCSFACEFGFFKSTVMTMELKNSAATSQRMMDQVLDGLIGEICFVYLDDIIIFSDTVLENLENTKKVLERLAEHRANYRSS